MCVKRRKKKEGKSELREYKEEERSKRNQKYRKMAHESTRFCPKAWKLSK